MAECEPATRLGCRNKDRCDLAALGMPSEEGGGGTVPSTGKKKFVLRPQVSNLESPSFL